MANEKNLENGKATQFRSGEEAARNGRIGGIASGAARRRKRSLKEAADLYLSLPVTDLRVWNKIARDGVEPEDIDNQMAIVAGLAKVAAMGDSKAAKVLFDLLGDADSVENAEDDGFVAALREEAAEVWQEE